MGENERKYVGQTALDTLIAKIKALFSTKDEVSKIQSALNEKVSTDRTINEKPLNENITLTASDVDAYSKEEINTFEFITVEDIDTICGSEIQPASDVMF